MTRPDPYADWDAAYVLGALSGPDRADFEEHLAECLTCRDAVAELAGLPGLLAKVPHADVLALDPAQDSGPRPPASLMPTLPPADRVSESAGARRRWLVPVAAAVALVVGGAAGYAVAHELGAAPPSRGVVTDAPVRLAFDDVVPSSMTAVVDVSRTTGDGTRLRVECQYAEEPGGESYPGDGPSEEPSQGPSGQSGASSGGSARPAGVAYALWVVDRSGRSTRLTEWTAVPGERRDPTVTTNLSPTQLRSIEIRLVDGGQTLLRADLPRAATGAANAAAADPANAAAVGAPNTAPAGSVGWRDAAASPTTDAPSWLGGTTGGA